jgi:hypothetical protein
VVGAGPPPLPGRHFPYPPEEKMLMGLLDFVKDIGKKVFTTEDEASA